MKKLIGWLAVLYVASIVIGGVSGGVGVNGIAWLSCDSLLFVYLLWKAIK